MVPSQDRGSHFSGMPPTSFKKRLRHRCFPVNFANIFKKIFFVELLRTVVSVLFYCNMNFHKCVCKNNFEYDNTFEEVKKSKERIVKNWFTKRPEKIDFGGKK